jgi:hypothetical protein
MAIAATRVVEEVTPCHFVIERRTTATVGGIHHNELVTAEQCLRARIGRRRNDPFLAGIAPPIDRHFDANHRRHRGSVNRV